MLDYFKEEEFDGLKGAAVQMKAQIIFDRFVNRLTLYNNLRDNIGNKNDWLTFNNGRFLFKKIDDLIQSIPSLSSEYHQLEELKLIVLERFENQISEVKEEFIEKIDNGIRRITPIYAQA